MDTKIVTYSKQRDNNKHTMPFSTVPIRYNNISRRSNNNRNFINRCTFFLHFLFNLIIIISFGFLIISFFYIIREEFRVKIEKEKQKLLMIREESLYNYRINRCELEIPYMKLKCLEWEKNSKNDEIQVGKLFVESIGEMVDTFVQRISWKAFILLGIIIIIYMLIHRNIR